MAGNIVAVVFNSDFGFSDAGKRMEKISTLTGATQAIEWQRLREETR